MASKSEIERLAGHALISNEDYRQWLIEDPMAAAGSIGLELNDKQAELLKGISYPQLEAVAKKFQQLIGLEAGPTTERWSD